MTATLKFKIAVCFAVTFGVGFSVGIYAASQLIGNWVELAK